MTASTRGQHPHHLAGQRSAVAHLTHPLDHSPEVVLALAAVLVVLAGPVVHATVPAHPLVELASAAVLLLGIALAVSAAIRLLRPDGV